MDHGNSMDRQIKVLFDTNVWLDKYLPGRRSTEASRAVLAYCAAEDFAILYPLRALADVYWQVMRDRKAWVRQELGEISEAAAHAINSDAWACVDNMVEVGAPVGADVTDVWIAQRLRDLNGDFEDNMVLAAARRAGVDLLVTSDRELIQKATIAALTPEDALPALRLRREELLGEG